MQCRACMTAECEQVVDMSSIVSNDGKTLYDYFNDCTQLQASSLDELPQVLCSTCTRNLQVAFDFRQEAHLSDMKLKNNLVEQKFSNDFIYNAAEKLEAFEDYGNDPLAVPIAKLDSHETQTSIVEEPFALPETDIKLEFPEELLIEKVNVNQIEEVYSESSLEDNCEDDKGPTFQSKTNYTCTLCNSIFKNQRQLKGHIFDNHKSNITCIKCPKVYEFPHELQVHESLVHGTATQVQCLWCEEIIARETLSKHIQNKHNSSYRKYFTKQRQKENSADGPKICCDDCSLEFQTITDLANHIKNHKFDCQICSMSFNKYTSLEIHMRRIHNRTIGSLREISRNVQFECFFCPSKFKLHKTYRLHMKNEHNEKISSSLEHEEKNVHECEICNLCFRNRNSKYHHKRRKHPGNLNDSLQTGKVYKKEENTEKSGLSKELVLPFNCYICSQGFKLKRLYQNHMRNVHNQNNGTSMLNDDEKLHKCNICDKSFKNRTSVYVHKKRKHPDVIKKISSEDANEDTENVDESIECKYCNKQIPSNEKKNHIRRHVYNQRKKSKFLCSFCPREFRSESSVRGHEKKSHLSERPEPKECPLCQKKLDPKYLKAHLENVHTSERKHICAICGDSFKSYILLHSHKQLHLERNFSCTMCEKKFIRSFDLKVHMRLHTGEEPYACHLCDRRFKIKVRLNYHLQRHAGIKRKCNVCGKEFNHVKQLKIHSYKHTGMPYRCSVCDYGCAPRDVFRKHLLRMHGMTMTNEEYCAMFKANTGRNPHVKSLEELEIEAKKIGLEYSN